MKTKTSRLSDTVANRSRVLRESAALGTFGSAVTAYVLCTTSVPLRTSSVGVELTALITCPPPWFGPPAPDENWLKPAVHEKQMATQMQAKMLNRYSYRESMALRARVKMIFVFFSFFFFFLFFFLEMSSTELGGVGGEGNDGSSTSESEESWINDGTSTFDSLESEEVMPSKSLLAAAAAQSGAHGEGASWCELKKSALSCSRSAASIDEVVMTFDVLSCCFSESMPQ